MEEQEFVVSFHVTCHTLQEAELWRETVLGILDFHQSELVVRDTDQGAFCSGHVLAKCEQERR
jgi:hypothetical protein